MAGTRSARTGRLAAMAAADRIKILLEMVDGDDFLHEILSTANQVVEGSMLGQPHHAGGSSQYAGASAASILDKNSHEAKKKTLECLDIARFRPI